MKPSPSEKRCGGGFHSFAVIDLGQGANERSRNYRFARDRLCVNSTGQR